MMNVCAKNINDEKGFRHNLIKTFLSFPHHVRLILCCEGNLLPLNYGRHDGDLVFGCASINYSR